MKTFLPVFCCLALCVGCASVRQEAATSSTDPKTGIVSTQTAKSVIIASGNSKTIVEKVRASAGKTSSVGASGVTEENNLSQIVDAIGGAIAKLFEAGFAAGKAAAGVPPLPVAP